MSASHNSSGQSSTAVSPAASQAVSDQISALGSSSPGWLNELQNLGYVSNAATAPVTVGTGTFDSSAGNGVGSLGPQVIPSAQGNGALMLGDNNSASGGNASLLQLLGMNQKQRGQQ